MTSAHSVILSTAATRDHAREIARMLLQEKLAACVQLVPIETMYTWQSELVENDEVLLLIKTRDDLYADIEKAILAVHNYEVPEIVQLQVANGLPDYLKWIDEVT